MGTFKIAPGTTPQQTQAIFNALQQQSIQRQNSGQNLRLQTSGGIVAVSVQQPSPQQQAQIQQAQANAANQATVVAAQAAANSIVESTAGASAQQVVVQGGQQQQHVQQQSQPTTPQLQGSPQVSSTQVRNIVKKRIQSNVKVAKNS